MKRILISKKFKLCCLFFFLSSIAYCQTSSNTSGTTPPSPNAASLGKFADTPVGYYTGTPQVNIPLFEITEGDVKLPISLDYHAGGVRVEETASAVGLGWALQAGGVVSRVKRGLVDEQTVGQQPWINGAYPVPTTGDPVTHANYWNLAADGVLDTEPDLFHFNFLGRTGKFFLDNQGIPHLVPFQKLIITPVRASNGTPLSAWTIKAEDGTEYLFSKIEKTKPVTSCNGIMGPSQMEYTSAWYLTEVRPVNTNGIITIEYDDYSTTPSLYEYRTISSSTRFRVLEQSGTVQEGGSRNSDCETRIVMYDPARVKRIKSSTALVEFVYGAERCDLKGDYMLDEIHHKRKNKDNSFTLVKKFKLSHKYFDGPKLTDVSPCVPTNSVFDLFDYSKRLMLVGAEEVAVNDERGKEHKFDYYLSNKNGAGLPSRLSYNQDHWGFFNGSNNDSGLDRTLIPATPDIPNGAFRQCEVSCAKVGSLKAITYPTKGRTEFDYELHDFYNRGGFRYETLMPRTESLGIRPHLQDFGQVTVSDTFKVKSTKASVIAELFFGFPMDPETKPCGDTLSVKNPYLHEYFYFEIWKHTGGTISKHRLYATDFGLTQYRLDTGFYYQIAHVIPLNIETYKANLCNPYSFSLNWIESKVTDVTNVGGLRIRKITDLTADNPQKTVKTFLYKENGISSGTIVSYPVYSYEQQEEFRTLYDGFGTASGISSGARRSRIFSSSSSQPLGNTQGAPVGYSNVTVYYGEDENSGTIGLNGKTVYKYTDPFRFPDKQSVFSSDDIPSYAMPPAYPFAPMDSQDWLRGLLLESSDYSREGNVYKIKRRIINIYTYYKNRYELSSWKAGASKTLYSYIMTPSNPSPVLQTWDLLPATHRTHAPVPFKMRTGYNEMNQSVEKIYESDTTKFMTTTTDYIYSDDHLQLLEKKVTNSDGKVTRLLTKYAGDFPSSLTDTDPASVALAKMKLQNRISVPVESRTLVQDKLVNGSIIKFKEFQTDKVFPHETYAYRTNKPVASPAQSGITNKQLVFEQFASGQGFEKDMIFNEYNDKGAIVSSQKAGSYPVSYIWDYFNTLPIAEVTNASSSDIAYTGFEHDGKGNWTIGTSYNTSVKFTGTVSYNVSPTSTISKTGLNTATGYKVSFWARSGVPTINGAAPTAGETINGWTYYERTLSGTASVTIAGTGNIDELRLCPSIATMTTYTYEPGRGVISTSDLNSVPTFYEYDGLNRLSLIKDHKGSILKRYEYNYQVE